MKAWPITKLPLAMRRFSKGLRPDFVRIGREIYAITNLDVLGMEGFPTIKTFTLRQLITIKDHRKKRKKS